MTDDIANSGSCGGALEQFKYQLLLKVVLPFGIAFVGFIELGTEPPTSTIIALFVLVFVSMFYGFNNGIALFDERYNNRVKA